MQVTQVYFLGHKMHQDFRRKKERRVLLTFEAEIHKYWLNKNLQYYHQHYQSHIFQRRNNCLVFHNPCLFINL